MDNPGTENKDEELFKGILRDCRRFDEGKLEFMSTWKQVGKLVNYISGCSCYDRA